MGSQEKLFFIKEFQPIDVEEMLEYHHFAIPNEIIHVDGDDLRLKADEELYNGWTGLSQPMLTSQKEREPDKYQPNTMCGHCLHPNPNEPIIEKTFMRPLVKFGQ